MDGSIVDHSDSDSGESWTLLEHSPAYAEDAPEFAENSPLDPVTIETSNEKDEDTDGISVISDSEPESSAPCEMKYDLCLTEESRPSDILNHQYISENPLSPNSNSHHESIRSENDFLGDNAGKHKTYVHRRNKRLSTVLNIIMLGSVITAAGVAIGHMWGARNECSINTTPSINKILSNLYKLQEENAFLRNKLKELTLASSIQMQQRKVNAEKIPFKQNRCKKVYEEPLINKNVEKVTKCIDHENINDDKIVNNHVIQPEYEKEFLSDIEKLKNIYQQNKSWLDDEIAIRMKNEEQTYKKMVNNMKTPLSSIIEEQKVSQDENNKEQTDNSNHLSKLKPQAGPELVPLELEAVLNDSPIQRITYADSLKSAHKIQKRDLNVNAETEKVFKDRMIRRKIKKDMDPIYDIVSEEELKKDDRYAGPKIKQDKKKRDRQKLHKKQKRRNKYEQWEMKGGYLKDYDEFSISSSQENEFMLRKPDRNILSRDFEKKNYIKQFSESNDDQNNNPKNEIDKNKDKQSYKVDKAGKNNKSEDLNWYDKRAVIRTEARKRLEHELFGETSPNNAGWYFRRMQRREQCRAKGDNSTYKKLSKRNMNFKMKH